MLLVREEKLATIVLNTVLSEVLRDISVPATINAVATKIGELIELEVVMLRFRKSSWRGRNAYYDQLVQNVTSDGKGKSKCVALIKAILADPSANLEDVAKRKIGVELIKLLADTAMLEDGTPAFLHKVYYSPVVQKRIGVLEIVPELHEKLGKGDSLHIRPAYLPMLVKPKPWKNKLKSGGYYRIHSPLVKTFSNIQRKAVLNANIPQLTGMYN